MDRGAFITVADKFPKAADFHPSYGTSGFRDKGDAMHSTLFRFASCFIQWVRCIVDSPMFPGAAILCFALRIECIILFMTDYLSPRSGLWFPISSAWVNGRSTSFFWLPFFLPVRLSAFQISLLIEAILTPSLKSKIISEQNVSTCRLYCPFPALLLPVLTNRAWVSQWD